jgi:hypothetical protein
LVEKKSRLVAGAFFALLRAFLKGVLRKARFWCGVFVVIVWWIRGELWSIEGCISAD